MIDRPPCRYRGCYAIGGLNVLCFALAPNFGARFLVVYATRNDIRAGLLLNALTFALLQRLRLARQLNKPRAITRRVAPLPFPRPFDDGAERPFALVL